MEINIKTVLLILDSDGWTFTYTGEVNLKELTFIENVNIVTPYNGETISKIARLIWRLI